MLFECVVGKCFVVFYVFSFPPAVYVGTLNLIASIPGPSILTLQISKDQRDYKLIVFLEMPIRRWEKKCVTRYISYLLTSSFTHFFYLPGHENLHFVLLQNGE